MPKLVSSLAPVDLRRQLKNGQLVVHAGPFNYRLQSSHEHVAEGLSLMYADYPVRDAAAFADFSLNLGPGRGLRRWLRRQVRFSSDGFRPFEPLPHAHAYPQMEWAMNWCVSTRAHNYLILHAAVLERHGMAVVLPAPPGSGKSTLCAGLTHSGWRLLSDELGLIDPVDRRLHPVVRPVSLKNQSIEVIQRFAPQAVMSPVTHNTSKGSVAFMKAPQHAIDRMHEPAQPRWVVFPRYVPGAAPSLTPMGRAAAMLELGQNSFNYVLLGRTGFDTLSAMLSSCECYQFSYSQLSDAAEVFARLADRG